ncbi:MAG TPA: hypothetical protein VNO22_10270 [Planctomycetota bacterium]|nr:hypothetical protein [Planctomycetota bacterium]
MNFRIILVLLIIPKVLSGQVPPTEEDAKKAEAILSNNPEDASANLVLGKYLAFVREDWDRAVSFLSKGSDPALKRAALEEQSPVQDGQQKVRIGDAWIDATKKFPSFREEIYGRAIYWYMKALQDLDEVGRMKLIERARKMSASPGGRGVIRGQARNWDPFAGTGSSLDGTFSHSGRVSVRISSEVKAPRPNFPRIKSESILVPVGAKKAVLSAWVRSEGTEPNRDALQVGFWDAGRNGITQGGPIIPADHPFWVRIDKTVEVPEQASRMEVWVVMDSTKGTIWIDDVSLVVAGKELLKNGGFEER